MKIPFSKYQGTGNDFVLVDNRDKKLSSLTTRQIELLCDRHFGIGADGFILLEEAQGKDFYMKYFNSDGNESSLCGNGGRCITAYANELHLIKNKTSFTAIDGAHEAIITDHSPFIVKLKMPDVGNSENIGKDVFLNTGSPHYVKFVANTNSVDIIYEARNIRYNERFREKGTNVNFVQLLENILIVRSYERGVEDETYSCGTGVVASVLAAVINGKVKDTGKSRVHTKGGVLDVYYEQSGKEFKNIWLEGEATFVFKGEIEI